jgi:hypothetical protein
VHRDGLVYDERGERRPAHCPHQPALVVDAAPEHVEQPQRHRHDKRTLKHGEQQRLPRPAAEEGVHVGAERTDGHRDGDDHGGGRRTRP